ncbi:ubiquitin-like activating enzyme [Penicillium riverlandense]|uniref:ubiquitin-like activating enzyme n=1 Tax=Penicillium riverlandense TaxID=1903569 RepID=UPI002547F2C5|nr:ubiquitin-like activating enzyme [Penicillium riverlandense]KAJ5811388.1 ubiquitin-like activating enzyme [Penicillium riverlandense]
MRGSSVKRSLGAELYHKIKESNVLLVGAGGIGCELLKNLLLTGFGEIHIIDLDTIDLSNLNRQFLFRHEHIKKPKALVAKEVAHKFQPGAKLEAYHANIKDAQFNVDWFKKFDVVFNALDNLDARRHVNHMCLAANVPLVESGTTGFNGQVQVIRKGDTECYECNPKETPKSFAVCTIRSTPSQPIHCIVWAKSYLFSELFGTSENEAPEVDGTENAENGWFGTFPVQAKSDPRTAQEIEDLRKEARELNDIRQSMGSDEFPRKVFEKVFQKDIERLRGMEDMWKSRQKPDVLEFDNLESDCSSIEPTISSTDQRVWALGENFVVFKDSLNRLSRRFKELQETSNGSGSPTLDFDKDDEDTLDFVAATANLRAIAFHIEQKSKFDTKQMAGNIIPAIATTNAMTAGLCVLQAFKVLQNDLANAKMVFLERSGARAINSNPVNKPNPACTICSVARGRVMVDPARATLQDLVEGVLRLELGYGEELSVLRDSEVIYDPDLEDNLAKKLSDFDLGKDSFVTVIDDEDEPRVNVELVFVERTEPASKAATLEQKFEIPRKPKQAQLPILGDSAATNGTSVIGKRKREAEDGDLTNGHATKRVAGEPMSNGDDSAPIVLEDDGPLLIDDD